MGVDIADIVTANEKTLQEFSRRVIAVDAHNALYQFLAIIRQPDGTPLKDSRGRITSHLSGVFYRNVNLLEMDIKPVYVFDGQPHPLKKEIIEERITIREEAEKEWQAALEAGDIERARTKAQQALRLTSEMVAVAKELLGHMGIPCLQAPGEGEAQASHMARKGDAWATASQDFDSLLFGAPVLVRNLTIRGRRKLPKQQIYVDINPEQVELSAVLTGLGITHAQLIDLGILIGTDFNRGIHGIGPKKALKLIKELGSLENIIKEKGFVLPNHEEIQRIFAEPSVTDDYALQWRPVDIEGIKKLLCDEYEFSETKVDAALSRIIAAKEQKAQRRIDQWF